MIADSEPATRFFDGFERDPVTQRLQLVAEVGCLSLPVADVQLKTVGA
jgi:hypothetical protein